MGFTDKAKSKVEQLAGAARERIGDERMRGEGGSRQRDAQPGQAGEQAKEAGRKLRDAFTR
ncbi:CsbD family protein [Micromonospora echinaurantiaca]|uniref:CsbD family protein n=1 Tax=Micromonospora TaxID=1873 RepID=UPI000D6EFC79|nr:CsbD family protein [Micromonospora sp. S4605]PWU55137.1 CsbD family protein [Micromonospora sp. S4605]